MLIEPLGHRAGGGDEPDLFEGAQHTGFSVQNRVRVEPEDGAAVEGLARYIMRIYEVDPLVCLSFGSEMKVITWWIAVALGAYSFFLVMAGLVLSIVATLVKNL